MLRISICDDDVQFCADLSGWLETKLADLQEEASITIYHDGAEFCEHWAKGKRCDLLFMDIEMQELDGISAGHFLRHRQTDEDVQIIYTSSNSTYAMQLFENRPFDFLLKPFREETFGVVMDRYLGYRMHGADFFHFITKRSTMTLRIGDIIYFETQRNRLLVHTATASYECYGKLDEVIGRAFASRFLRIHKSFYVNYAFIETLTAEEVRLTTGQVLQVSRSCRQEVLNQMSDLSAYALRLMKNTTQPSDKTANVGANAQQAE